AVALAANQNRIVVPALVAGLERGMRPRLVAVGVADPSASLTAWAGVLGVVRHGQEAILIVKYRSAIALLRVQSSELSPIVALHVGAALPQCQQMTGGRVCDRRHVDSRPPTCHHCRATSSADGRSSGGCTP